MQGKSKISIFLTFLVGGALALLLVVLVFAAYTLFVTNKFSINTIGNSFTKKALVTPTTSPVSIKDQYLASAKANLQGPEFDAATKTYSVTGIYYSTIANTITVVTAIGMLNFGFDDYRTSFQTADLIVSSASSSANTNKVNRNDFVKNLKPGNLIQIVYIGGKLQPQALKILWQRTISSTKQ